nr:hypothetical protein [Streptomyces sp. DSM 41633]
MVQEQLVALRRIVPRLREAGQECLRTGDRVQRGTCKPARVVERLGDHFGAAA